MDIFVFIKSIDKIALILFFLTAIALIYECSLFIKKSKDKPPKIPKFTTTETFYSESKEVEEPKESLSRHKNKPQKKSKEPNITVIILLIIFMLVLGAVYLIRTFIFNKKTDNKSLENFSAPTASEKKPVFSKGIKIYNNKWQEINNSIDSFLKLNETIIIGIETIPQVEITKARIRVNANVWQAENETKDFNKKFGVFYKEYLIATNESKLIIEAQLYSLKEGWPQEKYEKK